MPKQPRWSNTAVMSVYLLALLSGGADRALAQTATEEERSAEARLRGETQEGQSLYAEVLGLSQGRDKEAVDIYKSLLQRCPHMIEALNDLAYLQATSNDPAVRNPQEAVDNAEHLLVMALQRWVQRRRFRPPQNVKQPFANLPLAASFYKVTIMNTLAAAYASAGRFHSSQSVQLSNAATDLMQVDCKADAVSMATMALENAQSLADRYPSPVTERLRKAMEESLRTIQAGKRIHGPQFRFQGTS